MCISLISPVGIFYCFFFSDQDGSDKAELPSPWPLIIAHGLCVSGHVA